MMQKKALPSSFSPIWFLMISRNSNVFLLFCAVYRVCRRQNCIYQRKSNLLFKKISSNAIAKIVLRLSFWVVYSVTTQENGISRNMKSIFRKKWYLIISQCNSHFFSLLEWYVAWLGEKKASQGKPNQFFESIDFCWYRKICISSHFYGGVQRM